MSKLIIILLSGLALLMSSTQLSANTLHAWIQFEQSGHKIEISPHARADTATLIRYQFDTEKTGRSGTTRNHQGSRVKLQPGIDTSLSHLTLSRDNTDRYRFNLKVYAADKLVAEDTLILPKD